MTTLLLVQTRPTKAFSVRGALQALEPDAFEMTCCQTLTDAFHQLEERVFDVAILDLTSQDANDARAITTIRRLAPRLPIVVIVDPGEEALAHRALALGARDFVLKKPGQTMLLPRVIRHAIEMDRAEAERLQILDTLRASTARCRSLFENAVVGTAFATFTGRLTSVNTALCAMLGFSEEELIASSIQSLIEPDDEPVDWSSLEKLKDGSLGAFEIERRFRHQGDEPLFGLVNISVVRDASGSPLQLVLKMINLTRRRQAEEATQRSQEESRLILETAHDAFVVSDEEGVIRDWSPRAEKMFEWSKDEAVGRSLVETIFPIALRARHQETLQRFHKTGAAALLDRHFETIALRRDGVELSVEITLWLTAAGGHTRLNAFIRDISDRVLAEQKLRETEVRFRAIFEGSSIGMAIGSVDGRVLATNPILQKLLGYSDEELLGKAYSDLVVPEDASLKDRERRELMEGKRDTYVAERRYRHKDGGAVWLRVSASLVRDSESQPNFIVNVLEDLTERKQAEATLREKAMHLVELVAAAAIEASNVDEVLQICLHHVCSRIGWPIGHVYLVASGNPEELVPSEFWHVDDPERYQVFRDATMGVNLGPGEGLAGRVLASGQPEWIPDMRKSGMPARSAAAEKAGIKGALGSPLLVGNRVIGVLEFFSNEALSPDPQLQDAMAEVGHQLGRVIERKRIDAFYAHQAMHDPLTDMPNRLLFVERLRHATSRLERSGTGLALLFVDLDGFKDVNDSFGHDVGDSLLVALSQRIRALLRPGDTISRFGGDEFTILCEDLTDEHQAVTIAQRILEVFDEPVQIEDLKLVVTGSIGIALANSVEERPESLLRNADAAMYRAKERGGSCYQVFDDTLRKRVLHRRGMEWSLRRAVEAEQLRVFYQPSISLRDGSMNGLEALVRWQHPERGLLTPKDFIPLAEETGLVIPIGQWVFREACRQRARWREMFPGPMPELSVNLSSRQLSYSELPERLSEAIAESRLDPGDLCLEITETMLLEEDATIAELHKLRALGVALSIDDFGTGYSSLACLKRLPVAQIKLDRSFISGLGSEPQDSAIVGGIIDMAHALGLTVVAEGVETKTQLDSLKLLGCDLAQGFYFSPPQSTEATTEMLMEMATVRAA